MQPSTCSSIFCLRWVEIFMRALSVCVSQKPEDPRVLFLEGRLQLALTTFTDEHKAAIEKTVKLPELNIALAETKLRKSIQLDPKVIPTYMILVLVLLKLDKSSDALVFVKRGLNIWPRRTVSVDYVAQQLETMKVFLEEQEACAKPK